MIYLTRQVVLDEANYKSWRNGLFALLIKVLFFTIVERQNTFPLVAALEHILLLFNKFDGLQKNLLFVVINGLPLSVE